MPVCGYINLAHMHTYWRFNTESLVGWLLMRVLCAKGFPLHFSQRSIRLIRSAWIYVCSSVHRHHLGLLNMCVVCVCNISVECPGQVNKSVYIYTLCEVSAKSFSHSTQNRLVNCLTIIQDECGVYIKQMGAQVACNGAPGRILGDSCGLPRTQ